MGPPDDRSTLLNISEEWMSSELFLDHDWFEKIFLPAANRQQTVILALLFADAQADAAADPDLEYQHLVQVIDGFPSSQGLLPNHFGMIVSSYQLILALL